MKTNLHNIFSIKISGEWGDDDPEEKGVYVIRTANFQNDGKIDFSNLVTRLITKKINGKEEKELDVKKIEEKKLLNGDIIIEKSGGGIGTPVGRVVYFENPDNKVYLSNNFTHTLRIAEDSVSSKYMFYYLKHLYKRGNVLKYQNQTTGLFNLKLERYLFEEIDLPEISKQYAVVAKLDEIQKLIDIKTNAISIYESLKKSIFIKTFVNNRDRKKWDYLEISNYIKNTRYGIAEALNSENGIPTIRMNNITYEGSIDLSDLKYVNLSKDDLKKYELKDRDILFNRTNSLNLVGKCAVWEDLSNFAYAGYLFTIKLKEKSLNPYYFVAYLNSDLGKKILKAKAKQSGSMANFSASLLGKQKVLVPPISLQKNFEQEIRIINKQILLLNRAKNILQTLFEAILQDSFKPETKIDESLIFKDLLKKLTVNDLKNNKKRLQNLLDLFDENKFDNREEYTSAKEKLFELILLNEIEQKINDDQKIILYVK